VFFDEVVALPSSIILSGRLPVALIAASVAQSAASASIVNVVVTAAVPLTTTVPSPDEFSLAKPAQRFWSAVLLDVLSPRTTVPVYPPAGVTVRVSFPPPLTPWPTVSVLGLEASAMVPLPELTAVTFTVTLLEDPAYIVFDGYSARIVCDPAVANDVV
jgi:hypothetical protein